MPRGIPTIFALVLLAGPAAATSIGPSAFGPLAVMESFEGLTPGPNIALAYGQSILSPGTTSAFSFASGVVLTDPIPNPGIFNNGPFVQDFALATDVQNNWGTGRVLSNATQVPFGSAYLGAFASTGGTASVTFSFSSPMERVGAYVTGATGTTVQLSVYDGSGTLLESSTINTVALSSWGSNFLGIENLAGIQRVVFSGNDFGIDGLTFEPDPPAPVPEPGTLQALLFGLFGLLGLAMVGRRSPARSPSRSGVAVGQPSSGAPALSRPCAP
jgi:hypothetical protein